MSQWKWNDIELEVDMEDVDFQEKVEKAYEIMEVEEQNLQKIGKTSEITKAYCNMFYSFFDNVFGEGTGVKLLSEKKNLRAVDECYDSFFAIMKSDVENANKKRFARVKKYKVKGKK
ncbi:MAG: DUF6673 family protein [Lachnospiraceae bacterium]